MTKIGLIGPSNGEPSRLGRAVRSLIEDQGAEQAIYLGNDDAVVALATEWTMGLVDLPRDEERFLTLSAQAALQGDSAAIRHLLTADQTLATLSRLRSLPPPPARAVEMVADKMMIMVYDKAILDEEDIVNADIVVFGKAEKALLRRFGSRHFFSPGNLTHERVGMIEVQDDEVISIRVLDFSGECEWQEPIQKERNARVRVSS